MRTHMLSVFLALLTPTSSSATPEDEYSPFSNPYTNARSEPLLLKRQNCPVGYNNCNQNVAACCPTGSNCALDANGRVACCPSYAVCTGTIDGTFIATGTGTSTSAYPGTTTTSYGTAINTEVAGGGSTVPNIYYPFTYIPQSYANAGLCSSAWTACQSQSTACLLSVAGVNGVTVSGLGGGGITVAGATGVIISSASSICSTLSTSACYNLQESNCAQFSGGGVTGNYAGPRPTPCPAIMYAMGAGAVVGAAGALMQ